MKGIKGPFLLNERTFGGTNFPTREPLFVKFMKGAKLWTGITGKKYVGIYVLTLATIQSTYNLKCRYAENAYIYKMVEIVTEVLMGLCDEQTEKIFLISRIGMPQFWEETRMHPRKGNIIVTLWDELKGETGYKLHMLLLVDVTQL